MNRVINAVFPTRIDTLSLCRLGLLDVLPLCSPRKTSLNLRTEFSACSVDMLIFRRRRTNLEKKRRIARMSIDVAAAENKYFWLFKSDKVTGWH